MNVRKEVAKLIRSELERIRARNPQFSMRSLAKRAKVHPSLLSEVLSGKRMISKRSARKVLENLQVDPVTVNGILTAFEDGKRNREPEPYRQLDLDEFALIADWFYFAVRELSRFPDFRADPRWIAKKLGIRDSEAASALERLLRLGLLEKTANGRIVRSDASPTTTIDVPSAVLRGRHRKNLELAAIALEETPVEFRDYSANVFATSSEKLAEAKTRIQKFRRELVKFLEEVPPKRRDALYQVNVQLFPLVRETHDRKKPS